MKTKDFAEFVARQKTLDADADWGGMRDEWLRDLDSLYGKIHDYLSEYVADGSVSHTFTEVKLTEENIGTYPVRRMDIEIGRQRVHLVPVGTLLVGCKGRVDVVGSAGRASILLVDQKAKSAADLIKVTVSIKGNVPPPPPIQHSPISWAWKIVTNGPRRKFEDLEKEAFLTLLMEVANG